MERKFKVSFIGRKVGAIGIMYPIEIEVIAKDEDDAIGLFYLQHGYAKYEHISLLSVVSLFPSSSPICSSE